MVVTATGDLLPQLFDLKAAWLRDAGVVPVVKITIDVVFLGRLLFVVV